MNISFYLIKLRIKSQSFQRLLLLALLCTTILIILLYQSPLQAAELVAEPVQACIVERHVILDKQRRSQLEQCLGWQTKANLGAYQPLTVTPIATTDEIQIQAHDVSFYREGRSDLRGNVEVRETKRIINAQTAYVYRDAKTNQVTHIELLRGVRYLEPGHLMIARKATINPRNKAGKVEDVVYRFDSVHREHVLPAWGRASIIERFANNNYFLQQATYSTCPPSERAWHIEADSIALDDAKEIGVARHAKLLIGEVPVLYAPIFSFPTSKERKSGFLLPTPGYSNIGGFSLSLPYYWNIAPNYDATLMTELFTRRGVMMEGKFRYLSEKSQGSIRGSFLPHDAAYKNFLRENITQYPSLQGASSDRWSLRVEDITYLSPNLTFHLDYQQVSDDYYLQEFSTDLAILTERQLQRQADLTYTTEHWVYRGMLQNYQTLQPINQTPISDVYARLPQLTARGFYEDLPWHSNFTVLGQYDQFQWSNSLLPMPQGPRFYFNPILAVPQIKPWGYITPSMELVQNYYDVQMHHAGINRFITLPDFGINNGIYGQGLIPQNQTSFKGEFSRSIPRLSLDSGLYFERPLALRHQSLTQTLEPRLYYLYVPYKDQAAIPVYDSAYMIFNTDQLFRNNRFAGFDRVGDTNQLSYALTTRWISEATGIEKASFTIGQARYFAKRQVQLCQDDSGYCTDNPLTLGYLSPKSDLSPIASRALYHFNPHWTITGDYVWDTFMRETNNSHMDLHYQAGINRLAQFGYTYLANGDITQVARSGVQNNPLHQATVAFSWPLNERWSGLGAYNYNISKRYEMMSFMGVQYDSCCWAVRLVGGRIYQSLNDQLKPQFNNNVYLQIQLKGLGSVGNSNPISTIRAFLPNYVDGFRS